MVPQNHPKNKEEFEILLESLCTEEQETQK